MEREKNILGGTNASVLILFEEFQNRSGFEIEPGEACLIFSQIGSPIQTFRDFHLHLLVWKSFSLQLLA